MHRRAEPAARAAQAATRQGRTDIIFANMRALSDEQIIGYAGHVGLDVSKFEADYNSPEVAKEVNTDFEAGKAAGVRGTPTIMVNGKKYRGPRSLDGFKPVIDAEIKRADALIEKGTPIEKVYDELCKG